MRTKRNKDLVIAVSGDEGEGKSTLAILIAMAVHSLTKIPFSLEKNMIYTEEIKELSEKIIKLPKQSVIIPDEAIKALYKLHWASAGQKYINMLYALARRENKITILPIPRFTDVNEFFRNHRVKIWIHIVKEGHAIIFQKDWSPFSFRDPWRLYENEKLIEKLRKNRKFALFNDYEKIRLLKNCRNFVLYFRFPSLPDSIYGQYELLSGSKYDDLKEIYNWEDKKKLKIPYKKAMQKMITEFIDKGYDMNRISYLTGLPIGQINKIIEKEEDNENIRISI